MFVPKVVFPDFLVAHIVIQNLSKQILLQSDKRMYFS